MKLKRPDLDKPSALDACKYWNLAVANSSGQLGLETLVLNLFEKLMSEILHVTESASASSGSSGVAPAVVNRHVQVCFVWV